MALLASNYIAALRITTLDPSPGEAWTDANWLLFLSAAQREVCSIKHDAYFIRAAVPLVAGSRQSLPAGANSVMDAYENSASKKRVVQVQRGLMDEMMRWRPAPTQTVDANEWWFDQRSPTLFDVSPPNNGTGALVMLYGITPSNLTSSSNAMHLDDIYETPIKFFSLAEAYAANTKRQDLTKAGFYRSEGQKAIGIKSQIQVSVAPKVGAPGGQ